MPRHPQPQAAAALALPTGWRAELGRRIRSRRRSLGWSRERLAEIAGYSRNHVSKIERGEGSLDALALACAALGVRPSEVFASAGL